jgi:hypothetical protein
VSTGREKNTNTMDVKRVHPKLTTVLHGYTHTHTHIPHTQHILLNNDLDS